MILLHFFIKNIYEKGLLYGCESIQKKSINQSFIFYKRMFDKNSIKKITSFTKYLINKYFFVITLIFTLLFQIFFIDFKNIKLLDIEALDFLIILSLLTISAIFHEFGHASASRFYNSDCNEIGFGLYIYFFVFYSDVTNVWVLKRHQRAVVDISGIYFQLIFINFIIIIYLFSGYELLEKFIFISDLAVFYNLNPFLKMDGYWFVSDVFGVPNLIYYTKNMITTFFANNKPYKEIHYGIDRSSKIKYFLFLYVVLSNIFFCFFY
jgi:putative peptide zinc metalloprotease protein